MNCLTALPRDILTYLLTMDGVNRFFFSVQFRLGFLKNSDSARNEFGTVRFGKTRFGTDIVVIYYLCNS